MLRNFWLNLAPRAYHMTGFRVYEQFFRNYEDYR